MFLPGCRAGERRAPVKSFLGAPAFSMVTLCLRSGWPCGLRGVCGIDGPKAEGGDSTHVGGAGAAHRLPRGVERGRVGRWVGSWAADRPTGLPSGPERWWGAGGPSLWRPRALQMVGLGQGGIGEGPSRSQLEDPPKETSWRRGLLSQPGRRRRRVSVGVGEGGDIQARDVARWKRLWAEPALGGRD